jgi:restriction system protein
MRRKRAGRRFGASAVDALVRAPWWLSAGLGELLAGFFWLVAARVHLPGATTNRIVWSFDNALHTPALLRWAGWAAVVGGLLVAWLSWRRGQSRKRLLDRQRGLDDLRSMSWQDFELLVGECFRRLGYRVSETGQGGADGGVDLLLRRGAEKILVQCKQWRTSSVGAPVVREMFGLMAHHSADRVKIVCCGKFTREAVAFASGKPVDLIGGEALLSLVFDVQRGAQ